MYYIGIDLGTSAVKLLLMDENGNIRYIVSREYPICFPKPGWSEQNPEDWFKETMTGLKELLKDDKPAYIRVGRNAVEDIYEEGNGPFSMDKATVLSRGGDVAIIACGEMVKPALDAGRLLGESGISAGVVDMYCVKPLDEEAVRKAAGAARLVVTVEEHAPFGGLGSRVSQVVSACCPRMVVNLSLPDEPVITGTSAEVFEYYGLTGQGIARRVQELLRQL